MASFVHDLWESIFTPGPTPTLLVATNATFAALQVVLAGMLYATLSVHFVVLSALCAGLWAAINWFARELQEHQRREEAQKRRALAARHHPRPPTPPGESETEVEATRSTASLRRAPPPPPLPLPLPLPVVAAAAGGDAEAAEAAAGLKRRLVEETLPSPSQGLKSGVSTEDEWEKVSENENEKDK
ncbi:Pkr1-domain-containing protein [Trichocladium antarcticum]|uniref:Pkr1-domain-containing protein n=1 Tax=Trichocladium antarcticum TaxID=1450529 RepID=A0AAN6UEZ8_9PEZI|nr:Pkr1-domain-containing protein [Trichocladium antarcticum]